MYQYKKIMYFDLSIGLIIGALKKIGYIPENIAICAVIALFLICLWLCIEKFSEEINEDEDY